jgi:translation elongation factor EF-1beta
MADEKELDKEVEVEKVEEEEEGPKLRAFKVVMEIVVNDEELGTDDIARILQSDLNDYEFFEDVNECDVTEIEP